MLCVADCTQLSDNEINGYPKSNRHEHEIPAPHRLTNPIFAMLLVSKSKANSIAKAGVMR